MKDDEGDMPFFHRIEKADVAKRLSRYPEIPLGYSNADRWAQIEAGMLGAGVLARSADLASFVYEPGAAASQSSSDRNLIGILAAAVVAAIVLAAAGWYGPRVVRALWRRLRCLRSRSGPAYF